jgi:hypothetical protein
LGTCIHSVSCGYPHSAHTTQPWFGCSSLSYFWLVRCASGVSACDPMLSPPMPHA